MTTPPDDTNPDELDDLLVDAFDLFVDDLDVDAEEFIDDQDLPEATAEFIQSAATSQFAAFIDAAGLQDLPVHQIDDAASTSLFVEAFLAAVRDEYNETGIGTYTCVLRFSSYVTEDSVSRFLHSVSARISRIRQMASSKLAKFFVVTDEKMLFPEVKVVVLRMKRMTAPAYEDWFSDRRSRQATSASINHKLKDLL